jgi:hypothetical protein
MEIEFLCTLPTETCFGMFHETSAQPKAANPVEELIFLVIHGGAPLIIIKQDAEQKKYV